MLKYFGLAFCVAFVASASVPELADGEDFELPAGTITCQVDSPDRDECIKEAFQDMLPKLVNGLESLRIPPIDPYVVESHKASFSRGEAFQANGTAKKIKIYGASKAQILEVKTQMTREHISATIKFFMPEVFVEGYYRGEGRFNNIRIKSKGYFNVTGSNVNVISRTEGDIVTINGKEHMKMTKVDFEPTFGKMKIYASGMLPDPELNRIALDFINQYWPFMFREMYPETKKRIEPIIIDEANRFLLHVPLRKMLYYGEDAA